MVETTVWQVARRPRWIAMLLLALAIAGGFAALGQWQIGRAVATAAPIGDVDSERVVPLADVARPSTALTQAADGQSVAVVARPVPGDAEVLGGRLNDGVPGWWVIGRSRVGADSAAPAELALAYGWTADEGAARAAAERIDAADAADPSDRELVGRLVANDAPEVPEEGADPRTLTTFSLAALVNRWDDVAHDVYEGYVVLDEPAEGLEAISSPPRVQDVSLNWLNVFYAIEWVVFAGFALYLWYRLVRDTWEREAEEALEAAGSGSAPARGP